MAFSLARAPASAPRRRAAGPAYRVGHGRAAPAPVDAPLVHRRRRPDASATPAAAPSPSSCASTTSRPATRAGCGSPSCCCRWRSSATCSTATSRASTAAASRRSAAISTRSPTSSRSAWRRPCSASPLGLRGGWDMLVLTYFVVCGVSRLARFNVTAAALADETTGKVKYFEGTPIPTSVADRGGAGRRASGSIAPTTRSGSARGGSARRSCTRSCCSTPPAAAR